MNQRQRHTEYSQRGSNPVFLFVREPVKVHILYVGEAAIKKKKRRVKVVSSHHFYHPYHRNNLILCNEALTPQYLMDSLELARVHFPPSYGITQSSPFGCTNCVPPRGTRVSQWRHVEPIQAKNKTPRPSTKEGKKERNGESRHRPRPACRS